MPAANSLANPVAIRTVGPDDAAALRELRLEALRSCPTAFCTDPSELAVASVENGQFVFRGYLKDSLKNIGFTKDDMMAKMRELKLIAE